MDWPSAGISVYAKRIRPCELVKNKPEFLLLFFKKEGASLC
jgi:hypothetical protein